ncbi:MAG: MurR/RpiR family transcriptional regulator [Anaerolineales bacterium]|nr:MurR/RpiR family transcriptional regulator [Anaerolineales bacterium]
MSYEDLIREHRSKMSKSFSRLADYLLDNYVQAALMTATELAHQVDVDAATVVRFAQRLGYDGFPQLQSEIKEKVKQDLLFRPAQAADPNTFSGVVMNTIDKMQAAVQRVGKLLDVDAVGRLVKKIGTSRRVIIVPDGLGQVAAYNLLNLLEQGGFMVSIVQPGVVDLARTMLTASREDLVIAVDVAGASPFIARALAEADSMGIDTAAIVGAASHQSALEADVILAAQTQAEISMAVVAVDMVVYTLAEALRWKYQDRFAGKDAAIEAVFERISSGSR